MSRTVRICGTMTEDLLALSDWLAAANCPHVAMASTGVDWKPIWNLLEDDVSLLLVNPFPRQRYSLLYPHRRSLSGWV